MCNNKIIEIESSKIANQIKHLPWLLCVDILKLAAEKLEYLNSDIFAQIESNDFTVIKTKNDFEINKNKKQ